jgi:hypothetical protein
MVSPTTAYLLEQQRLAFKHNWESELENWASDWNDEMIDTLSDLDMGWRELVRVLQNWNERDEDHFVSCEYIFYNILNQLENDKDMMANDVKEWAKDLRPIV